jgi:hypothetical protein
MAKLDWHGRLDVSDRGLGLEAYEDDPEYTSPEMEPGGGEDRPAHQHGEHGTEAAGLLAVGLTGHAFDTELPQDQEDLFPLVVEDE